MSYAFPGGAISSTLVRALLTNLGLRKTMAIKTSMDAVSLAIGFLLIKERKVPGYRLRGSDGKSPRIVWFDAKIMKDAVFWSLAMCLFFCCMSVRPHCQATHHLSTELCMQGIFDAHVFHDRIHIDEGPHCDEYCKIDPTFRCS
jgi:hypothetical protein